MRHAVALGLRWGTPQDAHFHATGAPNQDAGLPEKEEDSPDWVLPPPLPPPLALGPRLLWRFPFPGPAAGGWSSGPG
eukprot:1578814-Alexandrium_andersonii.AAC.1